MEILWRTENLCKQYVVKGELGREERVSALDGVDLEIRQGETLGVVGESGSGKTTLGKVLIRLSEPTGGRILHRDQDITRIPETVLRRRRRSFQIVFQDPYRSLNPRMSAGNAVLEGVLPEIPLKERQEKARQVLEDVGISPDRFSLFPHQFSGGERQRISIARALAPEPEFLVCDEPTSNLDLSIQAQILNLFLRLKEDRSLTYLFISHDLKVVEFLSDRIAVMYRGRIVEIGCAGEMIQRPVHPYTRILVAAAFLREARKDAGSEPSSAGCSFAGRCDRARRECRESDPCLRKVGDDHFAACLFP